MLWVSHTKVYIKKIDIMHKYPCASVYLSINYWNISITFFRPNPSFVLLFSIVEPNWLDFFPCSQPLTSFCSYFASSFECSHLIGLTFPNAHYRPFSFPSLDFSHCFNSHGRRGRKKWTLLEKCRVTLARVWTWPPNHL